MSEQGRNAYHLQAPVRLPPRSRVVALSLLMLGTPLPLAARQVSPPSMSAAPGAPEATSILQQPAELDVSGVPLERALGMLHVASRVPVLFSPSLIPNVVVTCRCATVTVAEALTQLLEGTGLTFERYGPQVIVVPEHLAGAHPGVPDSTVGGTRAPGSPAPRPSRAGSDVGRDRRRGSIVGTVTDERLGRPVSAARVQIGGRAVLSDRDGSYRVDALPPGRYPVTVQAIGYSPTSDVVEVREGEDQRLTFALSEQPLQLEEVIVTGTPGGMVRRAIGNSVASVGASEITHASKVSSIQELLTGRVTGLDFALAPGNVGTGSPIRIRGVSSLALDQQPLVFVDGVRVNNSTDAGPFLGGGANNSGRGQVSVLEDFSPEEIESIEVIRGPAAATLYGTDASAGVIQIITRKGLEGAPEFTVALSSGVNFLTDPSGRLGTQWGITQDGELIEGFDGYPNIYEYEKYALGNDPFQFGPTRSARVEVRGGIPAVRYFLSAAWQDEEGIVSYNFNRQQNLRANIGVNLGDALTLDVAAGYVTGLTSFAQQLTEPGGIWDAIVWAQPELKDTDRRGFMRYTPEELATVEATRDFQRFTGSATFTHRLGGFLTQRLVVGLDRSHDENQVIVPRHPLGTKSPFGGLGLGDVQLSRPTNHEMTLDYVASVEYPLSKAASFTTSLGAQYYASELNQLNAHGSVLASPEIRSIEGTTRVDLGQLFVQNKSLGIYVQQQLNVRDRLFLTAAARADDNSAFGADFNAAIYPKISGAWVISEEPFWNVPLLNSLRLRTALGQAGRQPATFDAITLYEPLPGRGGNPAMVPGTVGNPNVGPEVATELEAGIDFALLNDRISGEFTYFHQWVRDALANLPLLPSMGFSGTEAANQGQLNNWGWEARLLARVVERRGWALELGFSGDHVYNRIVDMGGRLPTFDLQRGLPYPAVTSDIIVSAEFDEFGNPTNALCDAGRGEHPRRPGGPAVPCEQTAGYELLLGPAFSPYTFTANASLYLFGRRLHLYALAGGEHGAWRESTLIWCRFSGCFTNTRLSLAQDDPVYVEGQVYQERHPWDRTITRTFDASFWKLRQIGAHLQLPTRWVTATGAKRASISVSARDILTLWQKTHELSGAPIIDPEFVGMADLTDTDLGMMPPLSSVSVRLEVTF